MHHKKCAIIVLYGLFIFFISTFSRGATQEKKEKSVLVVLLIRNKQHTLPYFLTLFSNINYPPNRLSLYVRADHCTDQSINLLKEWLTQKQNDYHSVDMVVKDGYPLSYPQEGSKSNWTEERFNHIISLKEEALIKARHMWADYIWYLDVDAFLIEPNILWDMISQEKPIIAPMLKSLGTYSNYWCGMTENYWYQRTDDYLPILDRKRKGCFSVPMVHSCVLIDLSFKASDYLTFDTSKVPNYDGPNDDIIVFAVAANTFKVDMVICNDKKYGFIPPPLNANDRYSKDFQQLVDIKLEALVDYPESLPLPIASELVKYAIPLPPKTKMGVDHIYLINLARRPDRKDRMFKCFNELGIEAELFDAVDGKRLNATYLDMMDIKQLLDYKDPWSKRDMTYGEIGCFLSHYYIWEDIHNKGYEKVVVFEDDIRFEPFFIDKMNYLLKEAIDLNVEWDFVYLGRKKLKDSDEPWVEGSEILVHVDYSYWTLGYIITLEGARKLLRPNPLSKIIPVDEYIPIIFDKHPEEAWKVAYEPRDLKAYSAAPLMVFPTHYTGEEGYISDTETSAVIDETLLIAEEAIGPPSLDNKGFGVNIALNEMNKDEL